MIAATGRGCGTFLALRMDKLRRDNKVLRRMNKDLSHQVKKQGDELKKLKTSIQGTKLSHQSSTHHYTQLPPYRSHLLFGEIGTGAVVSVHWPADDLGIPSGAKSPDRITDYEGLAVLISTGKPTTRYNPQGAWRNKGESLHHRV